MTATQAEGSASNKRVPDSAGETRRRDARPEIPALQAL